jgi:potassium-transporting ATPase ATP-binding subunit
MSEMIYRGLHVEDESADEQGTTGQSSPPSRLPAPRLLRAALKQAFSRLRPDIQRKDSVLFVVEMITLLSIVLTFVALASGYSPAWVIGLLALDGLLLVMLLGVNFAHALAEARRQEEAASLARARREIPALRVWKVDEGEPPARAGLAPVNHVRANSRYYLIQTTVSSQLQCGDLVLVQADRLVPSDGEIVEGAASIDESAITGESTPVFREAGAGDCGVRRGVWVVSGFLVIRVGGDPGQPSSRR